VPAPRHIRRTTVAVALALGALAAAGPAAAAGVAVRPLVPLAPDADRLSSGADADRTLTLDGGPREFHLAGVRWHGDQTAVFAMRARTAAGPWGAWTEVEASDEPANSEPAADAHVSEPLWVGKASRLQVRVVAGRAVRAEAVLVDPGDAPTPARSRQLAARRDAAGGVAAPPIISRAAWGADERLRRGTPRIASQLRFGVVHHTAGSNSYGPTESAAVVRAIHRYHVRANGWSDIGYSYLVDRYGQVFEGRAGGVEENVIGAHAGGFNTGSFGVSMMGNYDREPHRSSR
jgi:uncharacterized protein with LGFP repeats